MDIKIIYPKEKPEKCQFCKYQTPTRSRQWRTGKPQCAVCYIDARRGGAFKPEDVISTIKPRKTYRWLSPDAKLKIVEEINELRLTGRGDEVNATQLKNCYVYAKQIGVKVALLPKQFIKARIK